MKNKPLLLAMVMIIVVAVPFLIGARPWYPTMIEIYNKLGDVYDLVSGNSGKLDDTYDIIVENKDKLDEIDTRLINMEAKIDQMQDFLNGNFTYYADTDEDGYGDLNETILSIEQPDGYVANNEDCDDADQDVNPDAEEVCDDGIDNDCDAAVDGEDTDCPSCDDIVCPPGEHCEMQDVICITWPCPPQPVCIND